MNYAKIRKFDVSNGPGIRSTLFVSGCTNKCEGCFNKELQDFNYGEKWTKEIEDDFIKVSLNTPITPCIVRPNSDDSCLYLILPIRINS